MKQLCVTYLMTIYAQLKNFIHIVQDAIHLVQERIDVWTQRISIVDMCVF
jgi:hypothetical protein